MTISTTQLEELASTAAAGASVIEIATQTFVQVAAQAKDAAALAEPAPVEALAQIEAAERLAGADDLPTIFVERDDFLQLLHLAAAAA
jgi:hypothetical protein